MPYDIATHFLLHCSLRKLVALGADFVFAIDDDLAGMYGAVVFVRRGVAIRAYPGPLEAMGTAAYSRLFGTFADPGVGAGGALSLHICRVALVVAYSRPYGPDGLGIHHGASTLAPIGIEHPRELGGRAGDEERGLSCRTPALSHLSTSWASM